MLLLLLLLNRDLFRPPLDGKYHLDSQTYTRQVTRLAWHTCMYMHVHVSIAMPTHVRASLYG